MINLELTKDEAKFLLIITGASAGSGSRRMNTYRTLHDKLKVFGAVPDPKLDNGYSVVVTEEMIQAVKCELDN